jgi:hypothetical protein
LRLKTLVPQAKKGFHCNPDNLCLSLLKMGLVLSKIAKFLRPPMKPAVQGESKHSSGKSMSDKALTTIGNHEKKIEAFLRKVDYLSRNAEFELQRVRERQLKGDTRGK